MKNITILLTALFVFLGAFFLTPKAKAIDPVTIALLTPVAIKAAQVAQPYVMRGIAGGVGGLVDCGKDVLEIFKLPLGAVQSTVGMPFGYLGYGVKNMALGGIAPLKLAWHVLILPVKFTGLG